MIIKKIQINGEIVNVYLENSHAFTVSLETYLNNKILINEEISEEEINHFKEVDAIYVAKAKLLSKLARKKLSENECIDFLSDNGISKNEGKKITKTLKDNHLIDDIELAEFIIDYSLMKKKGINFMLDKLKERKIYVDGIKLIDNYLDCEIYNKNLHDMAHKYQKMGKNKSNRLLNEYIKDNLLKNGYRSQEINELELGFTNNEEEIIIKEIKKFFMFHPFSNENITKITKKLLSKGFNYDIIKKAIRECDCSETN